jgi:Fe2+ or Zn2+ uptake regulation protein
MHLTAAQIYDAVHLIQPRIAFATVYNALHHLVRSGLIAEVRQPDGVVAYDRETLPHDHIICLRCGRLDDVPPLLAPSRDAATYKEVAARTGYTVEGHRTEYAGLCPECRSGRDS